MQKRASWKLLTESIGKSKKYSRVDINEALEKSINNYNTINEEDLSKLNELISIARDNGWYPTVTKYLGENTQEMFDFYAEIVDIEKDELIWEYYMLLKESYILKEFGMEEDTYEKFIKELSKIKV